MFEHEDIQVYPFEEIPKDRDIYLMDEVWMSAYEKTMTSFLNGTGPFENIGYISYAAARTISAQSAELSWYPNIYDRFHEVRILLPRSAFVTCVGSWTIDEKPHIFVTSQWLNDLHARNYSIFAMVDAIGVKAALANGSLTRERLLDLQAAIDEIASKNPNVAFVSFADSVFLKANWSVGSWDTEVRYSYDPEPIVRLLSEINEAYIRALEMQTYAVVTQGANEYYADNLLHISPSQNHVSMNSLGLPFAQITAIDGAARAAIRVKDHSPSEVYMDQHFFRSLRLAFNLNKDEVPNAPYLAPLAADPQTYFMMSRRDLLENLAPDEPKPTSETDSRPR